MPVRDDVIGGGPLWRSALLCDVAAEDTNFTYRKGALMSTTTGPLDIGSTGLQEQESTHRPRSRFAAIVRALDRSSVRSAAPLEFEDALPTRRINRTRRLLGSLPKPGKSRQHARRLR